MSAAAASKRGHAVIVGASIGGLVIARVLAESFQKITLIDRDQLPSVPATRRGTPQSRMVHGLLAKGAEALEELFPGLGEELAAAGVPTGDLQSDVHWYMDGRQLKPARSGLITVCVSRPLLEAVIRSRVAALAGVTIIGRHDVIELLASADRARVTGVRLQDRDGNRARSSLDADLVVDAAGRGTPSPGWLAELGYERPDTEEIRINLNYSTQLFRREAHHLGGRVATACGAYPGHPKAGIVLAQEGERLRLGIIGWGLVPPTDREEMARYASTLASPDFEEIIRTAVPLSEPATMRFPGSIRRRYERLTEFPDGYLVVADAVCSFNPFYGQGMTVAALEALVLMDLLRHGREDIGVRFFQDAARVLETPWSLLLGNDLRFPHVEGERTPEQEQAAAYMDAYRAAAAEDAVLGTALLRVANLLDPPTRLREPDLRERVLNLTAGVRS
jgi:2-polyprenyl-6-methoxyphenol hydroxylase-like FAD-dependent oxidoreductase